jgi:hypothetical protein
MTHSNDSWPEKWNEFSGTKFSIHTRVPRAGEYRSLLVQNFLVEAVLVSPTFRLAPISVLNLEGGKSPLTWIERICYKLQCTKLYEICRSRGKFSACITKTNTKFSILSRAQRTGPQLRGCAIEQLSGITRSPLKISLFNRTVTYVLWMFYGKNYCGKRIWGIQRSVLVRQRRGTAVTHPFEAHKPLLFPNLRRFLSPVRTKFSNICEDRTLS